MNEDVELFVWLLPVMIVVMVLAWIGLVWTRYMVTGSLEIIKMIGGFIL
ncbi:MULTISPECIES: hypothetical protein [unclassified Sporosarcina]|nr:MULTISPECIES: hypothetical protein [unclassified Sporosarcina]GKV65472.1 hypothetical protein NCCP2331_16250 [Sporosarcina sp. NCCP-2331]GLB55596.1 hypothetical protein NCCP2378_13830 [Sporosarcina sp. NCCP-2378]